MNILEYFNAIDLSYPIFVDDWILMQPFPNGTSRLDDPIKPFTGTVKYIDFIQDVLILILKYLIGFICITGVGAVHNIQCYFYYDYDCNHLYLSQEPFWTRASNCVGAILPSIRVRSNDYYITRYNEVSRFISSSKKCF